ncbi:MAG: adenylate/guanylate cyclase domain-containing protein [Chloroflexota bacterium]
MQLLNRLSTKSELIAMLLIVSLGSIITMGYFGWRNSRSALIESTFDQLTSVRSSKSAQIESYFENLQNQVRTMGQEESVISAMVHLNTEFKKLDRQIVDPKWSSATEQFYADVFFPGLSQYVSGQPSLEFYAPKRPAATYLQYHYISENPNPPGEKHLLDNPGDESEYTRWHERYHPFFRDVIERFGYYDIFLIDYDTNDIIYSVHKEVDFAMNLTSGPYSKSGLAEAVAAVHLDPQAGGVQVVDFQPYTPSYKAPAAFFATPIFNGPHIVGILAIQLPVDEINDIMTGEQNWVEYGLGESGETYLVGPDMTLRSNSRFLIEDKESYMKTLQSVGMNPTQLKSIDDFNTSILFQSVNTQAAQDALTGKKGLLILDDYRGVSVLSAYAPLSIVGFDWGIITVKDFDEVMKPVVALQNLFLILSGILVVVVSLLATVLSYYFVWPVNFLVEQINKVKRNEPDADVVIPSTDEYGRLSQSINEIVVDLQEQRTTLAQEQQRNEILLQNALPKPIAERVKRGETPILDRVQNVALLFAEINGVEQLANLDSTTDGVQQLTELFRQFESTAASADAEIQPLIGQRFFVTCGLLQAHLDHVYRIVDFATKIMNILEQSNQTYHTDLTMRIGIHLGDVTAGVVGRKRFYYDVWGDDVSKTSVIQTAAMPGTILVSEVIYERVQERHRFIEYRALPITMGGASDDPAGPDIDSDTDSDTREMLRTWAIQ